MVRHPSQRPFCFFIQGRYAEAESLHTRSLSINERAHGKDHPKVATDLNSMAVLLIEQVRAESTLFNCAVEIQPEAWIATSRTVPG